MAVSDCSAIKTVFTAVATLSLLTLLVVNAPRNVIVNLEHAIATPTTLTPWNNPTSLVAKKRVSATPATMAAPQKAQRPRCILYDRPLRTGSTTISRTLDRCLQQKGYHVLRAAGRNITRENVMHRLAADTSLKRASLLQHVYATVDDFASVTHSCHQFFYISSCANMMSRILSMMKYATFEGHSNHSVDAAVLAEEVERKDKAVASRESFFEEYPYVDGGVAETDRISPHFIIRKPFLMRDLRNLLDALGCQHVEIESMNVHELDLNTEQSAEEGARHIEDVLSNAEKFLRMGDHRFRTLMSIAGKSNQRGLQLAKKF